MRFAVVCLAAFACLLLVSIGCSSSDDVLKPPDRFVDNLDGTVTDTQTNLMWEQKTNDGTVHDVGNLYTLGTGTPNWETKNGTVFTIFLAGLNAGAGFAGHTDWRLPTSGGSTTYPTLETAELESIVELGHGAPAINPILGPTASNFYWSSSAFSAVPSNAWGVYFSNGGVAYGLKNSDFYVRAVRGAP
jgi:hypothetical protein